MYNFRLDGKKAAVTGASKGIGAAIALALAESGADVLLIARDEDKLKVVCDEVRKLGRNCEYCCIDVSDQAEVATFEKYIRKFGGIDIYVNNAAFTMRKAVLSTTYEDMEALFNTNFFASVAMTQIAANYMIEQGKGGVITFITSVNALAPLPNQAIYSCTKCSLEGLVKSLAVELAPHGIRVNSIAPGAINTDMNGALTLEREANYKKIVALGRIGTTEEVALPVVFICSDAASYITGSTLVVDGGISLRK